eukprot:scaffold3605_cov430-Prasinococcus_capsulatus_cf.AAC.12
MVAPTLDLERSIVSASSGQVEIDPVLELENAFREVNVSSDEVKVKNATGEAAGDLSEASFQELAKTKSTSQLKADLKARDVDFSDCLEKGELIDRLVSCEAWRNDVQEERARQMHSRPRIVEADSLPDTCFEEFKAANNLVHQCLKLSIPAEAAAMSEVILRSVEAPWLIDPSISCEQGEPGLMPIEKLQEFAFHYGSLREMGFDPIMASGALRMAGDNMQDAANFLTDD